MDIKKANKIISWYEMQREAVRLTLRFYEKINTDFIDYHNKILETKKFPAYIKEKICKDIFLILINLHTVRLSGLREISLIKNPLNEFIVEYLESEYEIKYVIKWRRSLRNSLFFLTIYYGWLIIEFFKREIVFNWEKKNYKLAKEAVWGFRQPSIKDDMMIDSKKFTAKDMLMLRFSKGQQRDEAFKEARKRGYDTDVMWKLKININKNIFSLISFYFLSPFLTYFKLFGQLHLFRYMASFYKNSFPIELLMNLYNIKCFVSYEIWTGIEKTLILNKYKTKNIAIQTSDMTGIRGGIAFAFSAYDICYTWGDMHYDYHSENFFIDKKVNIGCVYKKACNKTKYDKKQMLRQMSILERGRKMVTFFDNSFSNSANVTESLFIKYLDFIKVFCERNKHINVLLKPKSEKIHMSKDNQISYAEIRNKLAKYDNFIYLDPLKWHVEDAIAISDVCINMSMSTPATIALISGKNAFYFDDTDNKDHYFSGKFRNVLVFENKDLLFRQINNILDGRFNCADVISEREIRAYDAFNDDNALERLTSDLYELTKK